MIFAGGFVKMNMFVIRDAVRVLRAASFYHIKEHNYEKTDRDRAGTQRIGD